ncbi:hypothetical protein MRX96_029472 [Rhipicephalus microplus]
MFAAGVAARLLLQRSHEVGVRWRARLAVASENGLKRAFRVRQAAAAMREDADDRYCWLSLCSRIRLPDFRYGWDGSKGYEV